MSDEYPFYFKREARALFGMLHRPPAETLKRNAFVFCHPFAEEKLWTHRVFVSYARSLAKVGHPVLRFDFTGNGDSEGAFKDLSMDVACADLRAAIEQVQRLTEAREVSLLGMRLGASVAGLVADEMPEVRQLVLWAPITDGSRHMQELLRTNVMTQMATFKQVRQDRPELIASLQQGQTVNIDGYEMGLPLFESVSGIGSTSTKRPFGGPCLIVQVEPQPRPAADLQRLTESYCDATLTFAQEEPFWKEIARFYQTAPRLFSVTDEWLAAQRTAEISSSDTHRTDVSAR